MTKFTELNLHTDLLKSLEKVGFETATPIQAAFIPQALQGGDVMASAQTGSGKTAAFLLPAFQKILEQDKDLSKAKRKKQGIRTLVLTPTRELADQVMSVAKDLRAFADISVKSVTGGMPIERQKRQMKDTPDVLVATPGRLIDLMLQKVIHLQDVQTFVLDEADRMLDMGFSKDVLKISRAIPATRQTFLLSATLEGRVDSIIQELLNNPESIELTSDKNRHEHITQVIYRAAGTDHKFDLLKNMVEQNNMYQAVIFTNTKRMTETIADSLRKMGEKVDFLHGDMRQSARNVSVKKMQSGQVRFLIATDVAARGLDIKTLTHVINFDLPLNSEDYIHRIGRVGRAGNSGDAISLVSAQQMPLLRDIEKMLGANVEEKFIEGLEFKGTQGAKMTRDERKSRSKKANSQASRSEQKQRESINNRKKRLPEAELSTGRKGGSKLKFSRSQLKDVETAVERGQKFKGKGKAFNGKGKYESKFEGKSEGKSFAKKSFGNSEGRSEGRSFGKSFGKSEGRSEGRSFGKSFGKSEGRSEGRSFGKSFGNSEGRSEGRPFGNSEGKPNFRNKTSAGNSTKRSATGGAKTFERGSKPSARPAGKSSGRPMKSGRPPRKAFGASLRG